MNGETLYSIGDLARRTGLTVKTSLFALGCAALVPAGRVTETMSWLSTLDMAGGAAGAAVFAEFAGVRGGREALVLVPVLISAAAAVSWRVRAPQRC
ncbi:hypothetical protein AB0933_29830 [Streptomyces venezuelae]|uniref:hypothetical protein n=1 Tax=Streptomyces venezuelae TaxID=54571 RepID=UPI003451C309